MEKTTYWNAEAARLLGQFLRSPTGELFLAALRGLGPRWPMQWDQVESVALSAARMAGYQHALELILWLAEESAWKESSVMDFESSELN